MIDVSYNIPRLPLSGDNLDYQGANAIEYNLLALIKAWPAFETLATDDKIGTYDYLDTRDNETGTPADGIKIELIQYLPRLIVLYEGTGLENVTWEGFGWAEEAPGVLVYQLSELTASNAMAALRVLKFRAAGAADLAVTLAAENLAWEPDGLRLYGGGKTMMLFRGAATWNLAKAKLKTWGAARSLTWNQAKELRKEQP